MSNSLRPHRLYVHGILQDRTLEVGSLSLLQGIFLTQRLKPGLPHRIQILYQLSYEGSPATPKHNIIKLVKTKQQQKSTYVNAQLLSCVWLFVTLQTVACQALLSLAFSRQESWSGLPFPSPGDLLDPGTESTSLASLAFAGGFFTTEPLTYLSIITLSANGLKAPIKTCSGWLV